LNYDCSLKEGKQAEFLMFDVFPWTLVEKIGTIDPEEAAKLVNQGFIVNTYKLGGLIYNNLFAR
jgi:ssDNA thymidine ADP-ribosyltransferase, DarT